MGQVAWQQRHSELVDGLDEMQGGHHCPDLTASRWPLRFCRLFAWTEYSQRIPRFLPRNCDALEAVMEGGWRVSWNKTAATGRNGLIRRPQAACMLM